MNKNISKFPLILSRKIYKIVNPESSEFGRNWKLFSVKEYANKLIYDELVNKKPSMIARLGSNELNCMTNYIGIKDPKFKQNYWGFIKGTTPPWWWEDWMMFQMNTVAGFFPNLSIYYEKFSELMISLLPEVDILGSWLKEESFFSNQLINAKKVVLEDLEPFFTNTPWTFALKGKKVLVVHPFVETIQSQYNKRELIFDNNLLPEFTLLTLKSIQSYANEVTKYADWFEALESLKLQINSIDFDICILGCGAYGFPLAAHVKQLGKKALHLGGVTQLLFGIKGKRWEEYIVYPYTNLYNLHWVRPSSTEKPRNASIVEGATYW